MCNSTMNALLATTALALAALATPQMAAAQSVSEVRQIGGDEIVVTARKREERQIDAPVAITALSRETINRYGITDVKAITQAAPTLFISAVPTGSGSSINIRGLGSLGADAGVPNEVVFNIDGIPVNRGRAVSLGILDIKQIEVLKGPQSLFFGRNSPAGVVSILSADPGRDFGGYVRASYEFASVRPGIEAAIDVPFGEDISARIAGKFSDQRGYIKNVAIATPDPFGYAPVVNPRYHKYQDGSNDAIGRVTLVYDSGPVKASLKFTYNRFHHNSELGSSETICGQGVTVVTLNNGFGGPDNPVPGADCKLNKRTTEVGVAPELVSRFQLGGNGKPFSKGRIFIGSLPITYTTDNFSLTSVSGIYGFNTSALSNSSYSSFLYFAAGIGERYRQYSQELRAELKVSDALKVQIGGYYEHNTDFYTASPYFLPLGPDSRNNRINSATTEGRQKNNSVSAFASMDLDITPTLKLSGGARYTHEKKTTILVNPFVNDSFFRVLGFNFLQPENVPIRAPYSEDNVSPEVTLSWRPQPNLNIYGAYKTGFKAGGTSIASVLAATTASALSFKAEKAKGGEFGTKFELDGRRIRGDFTIYKYVFSNLQVSALDQSSTPPKFLTTNAAKAVTKGAEFQVTFDATENLSLRSNVTYNDAHYLKFTTAPCSGDQTKGLTPGCNGTPGTQDLSGRPLPRAPKWNVGGGFTFNQPVGDLTLTLNGDATYMDRFYASDQLIRESYQKSWVKLDAAIRLSSPAGWDISLSGRNLTDHLVQTFLFDRSGSSARGGIYSGPTAPAREVTLSVGYRF